MRINNNVTNVPPISINSVMSKKRKAQVKRKFVGWDNALEDLLAQPISPQLNSKKIGWRPMTVLKADSVPIDVSLGQLSQADTEPNTYAAVVSHQTRAKDNEMKTRELMVRNMITSQLTPRKKPRMPHTGSTNTSSHAKKGLRDRREVETIIHSRGQKPIPITEQPMRKIEHLSVARRFDVYMPPSIRSAMGKSTNFY